MAPSDSAVWHLSASRARPMPLYKAALRSLLSCDPTLPPGPAVSWIQAEPACGSAGRGTPSVSIQALSMTATLVCGRHAASRCGGGRRKWSRQHEWRLCRRFATCCTILLARLARQRPQAKPSSRRVEPQCALHAPSRAALDQHLCSSGVNWCPACPSARPDRACASLPVLQRRRPGGH